MTDEPNNPIHQPDAVAADPRVGQADAVPSSAPTSGADTPAEPEAQTGPPPDAPEATPEEPVAAIEGPQTSSQAEPQPAETPGEAEAPETPAVPEANETVVEGEAAGLPVETEAADAPVEVEAAEAPVEGEAAEAPVEAEAAEAPVEAAPAKEPDAGEASEKSAEEDEEEEKKRDKSDNMDWYILKVQSNREDSIREGLLRRVAIAGLERYFGDIIVPVEQVTEFKAGKKRVTKRKLYPGYLVVEMEINDDTWFLVRETPGIGDFTGAAGHPTPMLPHEVSRILARQEEKTDQAPKLKIAFSAGDRVKITEGTFENFEGEVHTIDQTSGRVIVMINIFGRSTPVELEYWQIESI